MWDFLRLEDKHAGASKRIDLIPASGQALKGAHLRCTPLPSAKCRSVFGKSFTTPNQSKTKKKHGNESESRLFMVHFPKCLPLAVQTTRRLVLINRSLFNITFSAKCQSMAFNLLFFLHRHTRVKHDYYFKTRSKISLISLGHFQLPCSNTPAQTHIVRYNYSPPKPPTILIIKPIDAYAPQ